MASTKFTPEVHATILEALVENPSIYSAAAKAGIHVKTLYGWLRRGDDGDVKYADFALEVAEARRSMKDDVVRALRETACDTLHPQQTKAAQLLLQNYYPNEFASVKHTVSHKQDEKPKYDVSKLAADERRQLHRLLTKLADPDAESESITVTEVKRD